MPEPSKITLQPVAIDILHSTPSINPRGPRDSKRSPLCHFLCSPRHPSTFSRRGPDRIEVLGGLLRLWRIWDGLGLQDLRDLNISRSIALEVNPSLSCL